MVHAHACSTAGTAFYLTPSLSSKWRGSRGCGLGNSSHDFVIDPPVKEVLFVYELYVNFLLC
jgi:hypothetical protein